MVTATASKRSLTTAQRDWLTKMGAALSQSVTAFADSSSGVAAATSNESGTGVTSVTFTVTDEESGDPIVGASISIEDVTRETDGEGIVQFSIDPGNNAFRVTSDSHQNVGGTFEAAAGANAEQHVKLKKEAEWIPPPESEQPTLRKGDDSSDGWVEYMQSLLNHQFDEDVVPHNGKFDSETEKWVIKFQEREKLAVDGIVGNQTWAALREAKPQKPGTDERTPHSYEEKGAEGRWMTEDASFVQYAKDTDELVMAVMSVGDAAIDKFEATIRVIANGSDDTISVVIGPPFSEADSGDAHAHRVRIPRFRATYGPGTHDVEAYLPQELGGDQWKGNVEIPDSSTPPPVGGPGSVSFTITDSKTGLPIETAKITVAGKTIEGQSSGNFTDITSGELPYSVTAAGYKSDSGKILVAPGVEAKLVVALATRKSKPPRRPTGPGAVSYEIIDNETHELVKNARVAVGSQTADGSSKGVFVNVPKGKQPYTVAAEGYLPVTGTIDVPAGEDAELKVELKPGKTPAHETGSIEVALKWDGKDPAGNLKGFRVFHHGSAQMGVTDADGKVDLKNVPAGEGASHILAIKEDMSANGKAEVTVVPGKTVSVTILVKTNDFYDPKEMSTVDVTVQWDGEGSPPSMEGYRVLHLKSATAGITDTKGKVRLKVQVGDGASLFNAISKDRTAGGDEVAFIEPGETNSVTILVSEFDDDDGTVEKADVSVQVSDAVTKKPIDSATIKVADETAEETANTFLAVPLGDQPYHVTAPGYKAESGTIHVESDVGAHLEIKLQPDGTSDDDKDNPTARMGSVEIVVIDRESKDPIPSAKITVAGKPVVRRMSLVPVYAAPVGKHPFRVTAEGYTPVNGTINVQPVAIESLLVKMWREDSP
jgi:hypothetical protein